jgi:hypothetical protein
VRLCCSCLDCLVLCLASPLSCSPHLTATNSLQHSSLYNSPHLCCLHRLLLSPLVMLCDICVGVIQYRRGMHFACTKLNGEYQDHSENFEDILENLYYFRSSHHPALSTLTDSVSRGCRICRSLWEGLSEHKRDSMRNFDTTAEDQSLTTMTISYTTDRSYEVSILISGLFTYRSSYSLEPGQCWS